MNATAPFTSGVFDSEQGVLNALITVRNSTLSPNDKALLRNLFLDYAAATDEQKAILKTEIEENLGKLSAFLPGLGSLPSNTVTDKKTTPVTATKVRQGFGQNRIRPSFGVSAQPTIKITTETRPKDELVDEPLIKDQSTTETTTPAQDPHQPVISPTSQPAPTPTPEVATDKNHKARINEIKHAVNSAIGNPVNLVEANEAVGREYMAALLEAIKRTAVGGPAADEALVRLEKAYTAAEEVIKTQSKTPPETTETTSRPLTTETVETKTTASTPPKPIIQPTPPSTSTETNRPTQAHTSPTAIPAKPEPVASLSGNVTSGLYHRPEDEVINEQKQIHDKATVVSEKTAGLWKKETASVTSESTPTPVATPITTPTYGAELRKVSVRSPEQKQVKPATPVTTPAKNQPLQPLSATTTLPERISKLEKEVAKKEEQQKQPITDLNSLAVTEGLKQLLSEWKIFKASGFLGMGPSGIDHPLYKQLANLPMASVIAGRFEGVTPEIKQALTSYMNGWRYEHGIMHDMGESFETYLRRVIKHILERQRRAQTATKR